MGAEIIFCDLTVRTLDGCGIGDRIRGLIQRSHVVGIMDLGSRTVLPFGTVDTGIPSEDSRLLCNETENTPTIPRPGKEHAFPNEANRVALALAGELCCDGVVLVDGAPATSQKVQQRIAVVPAHTSQSILASNSFLSTRCTSSQSRNASVSVRRSVIHPCLTVEENVTFHAQITPVHIPIERRLSAVREMHLEGCRTVLGSKLSASEQLRLTVAMELLVPPEVLVLIDPTEGMSNQVAMDFVQLLRNTALNRNRSGPTVILSLSTLRWGVLRYLDDIILLDSGELAFCGPTEKLFPYFSGLGFDVKGSSACDKLVQAAERTTNGILADSFRKTLLFQNIERGIAEHHRKVHEEMWKLRDENLNIVPDGPQSLKAPVDQETRTIMSIARSLLWLRYRTLTVNSLGFLFWTSLLLIVSLTVALLVHHTLHHAFPTPVSENNIPQAVIYARNVRGGFFLSLTMLFLVSVRAKAGMQETVIAYPPVGMRNPRAHVVRTTILNVLVCLILRKIVAVALSSEVAVILTLFYQQPSSLLQKEPSVTGVTLFQFFPVLLLLMLFTNVSISLNILLWCTVGLWRCSQEFCASLSRTIFFLSLLMSGFFFNFSASPIVNYVSRLTPMRRAYETLLGIVLDDSLESFGKEPVEYFDPHNEFWSAVKFLAILDFIASGCIVIASLLALWVRTRIR